jgi:hypothetical protein
MLCPFFSSGRQTLYFTVPVDLAIFLKLNKNFLLTLWRSQLYFTVPEALAIFFFKWNKNFIFFHLEEGLIIYLVEEPILLNSAEGSREFFSSGRRTFIAFVEEPTLLHSAGGSRVFFSIGRRTYYLLCGGANST